MVRNTCTIKVSNSLDPYQARHFVGPDQGPYYLQKLSANNTNRLLFVLFDSLRPINNLSVKQGRVFLG